MRSTTIQGCIGLAFVASTISGLGYLAYRQLSLRAMQAEARLLLSYMQTLQSAYHIEKGRYAHFERPYGAPILGQDFCEQPLGAAQLGFLIHGCHDIKAHPPHYVYRSLSAAGTGLHYRLEAEGGTDAAGRSLVCFNPGDRDVWSLEQGKPVSLVQSCW